MTSTCRGPTQAAAESAQQRAMERSEEVARRAEAEIAKRILLEQEREERLRREEEQAASRAEFDQLRKRWGIECLIDEAPTNPLFMVLKKREGNE